MPNRSTATFTVIAVTIVLAGSCLLLSVQQAPADGRQAWAYDSLLRPVVELLALNYEQPTPHGVAVKALVLHVGTAVVFGIVAVGWFAATRREMPDEPVPADRKRGQPPDKASTRVEMHDPAPWALPGAQIAMLVFLGLASLSALWSHAPESTEYAALLLAMQFGWAFAITQTLTIRGTLAATVAMVAVLTLTALMGVWYDAVRAPAAAVGFPLGSPLFLGACLAPGLILGPALAIGYATALVRARSADAAAPRPGAGWWIVGLLAAAVVPLAWAFVLTGARVAQAALVVGILPFVFFISRAATPRTRKLVAVVVAVLLIVSAGAGFSWLKTRSSADDSHAATLRGRLYALDYAVRLFHQQPVVGNGQGTFALLAPDLAPDDRLRDPAAFFKMSVVHARNEWLQVLAEEGIVGALVLGLAYVLTFLAGAATLRRKDLEPTTRWCLIGLLTALAVMMIEEGGNLALRTEAFPTVYYTVLGLIWALVAGIRHEADGQPVETQPETPRGLPAPVRVAGLFVGLGLAAVVLHYAVLDWGAARDTIRADEEFARGEFAGGLGFARRATLTRLNPVHRTRARIRYLQARADTTRYFVENAQRRLGAARSQTEHRGRLLLHAAEDFVHARIELNEGLRLAGTLRAVAPGRGSIARPESQLAGFAMLIHELSRPLAETLRSLGIATAGQGATAELIQAIESLASETPDAVGRYRQRAVAATERLVRIAPFAEASAIMLWRLKPDQPLENQIKLFLRVLRGGWVSPAFRAAAMTLAKRPDFAETFAGMLRSAGGAATSAPATENTYAPDILRLAALLAEWDGRDAEGAQHADDAVKRYRPLAPRFPTALPAALADLARMRFHADPGSAAQSAKLAREALAAIDRSDLSEAFAAPVRRDLVLYLLAAGDESAARTEVVPLTVREDPNMIRAAIGELYATLAGSFLDARVDRRPPAFERWMQQALTLNPGASVVREAQARWAIERKRGPEAAEALQALLQSSDTVKRVEMLLGRALEAMPGDEALMAFVRAHGATTQPATASAPAIAPTGTGPP